MASRLDFATCTAIVESTLRGHIGESVDLSPTSILGAVLLTPAARVSFRQAIRVHVKAEGFRIKLADIPFDPHLTIRDVALALVHGALPGDPRVPDDD